jgi:hypothetical protein
MSVHFFYRLKSHLIKITFLSVCLFIIPQAPIFSQSTPKASYFLDLNYHQGTNYYPGGELEDELANGYSAIDIKFGWQPYNQESWAAIFNYANYGVGFWASHVGPSEIFGDPMAVYIFVNLPIYRTKNIEVMAGPAFGVSFNFEPYNAQTNPQNDITGGTAAAFFNPSLSVAYKITNDFDLSAGLDYTHMSNGGLRQPNTGFDMYGWSLGLRWHLNRNKYFEDVDYKSIFPEKRENKKDKTRSINALLAVGLDQKLEDQGTDIRYNVATATIEYQHKFNEVHGISAGLNLFYDESVKQDVEYETYGTTVFPAIHFGYDFRFWIFSMRPHLGYLLTKAGRESKESVFMKLALTVDITEILYFQAAVKTESIGFKADYADFGFGVRLFKK